MTAHRATLHLLVGPVGAGKTTYARRLAAQRAAVFFDVDPWMVRLFGADARPAHDVITWYLERRARCRALIWDVAVEVLHTGVDVVLELGLVTADERAASYADARDLDLTLCIYLVDAPRDVRRERVARRNQSPGPSTQVVPLEFFERASDAWQPPTDDERRDWALIDV